MNPFIDEFLRAYQQQQEYYARVAEKCELQLSRLLRASNIRAIVSGRAKKLKSLHGKLQQRNAERARKREAEYSSVADILTDIRDLAGARVALYFPKDAKQVNQLIAENFLAVGPLREFPRVGIARPGKRFSGYEATHHLIRLQPGSLERDEEHLASALCEIQVASVLMHAWSEVEHDLEYKESTGPISPEESALLDQINGLVVAGEIGLSQLQESMRRRVRIRQNVLRDHYDLANWLIAMDSGTESRSADGMTGTRRRAVGEAEYAFRFLQRIGMTSLAKLGLFEERLRYLIKNGESELTLSDALRDLLLLDNPEYADMLEQAREEAALTADDRMPDSTSHFVGSYIKEWQELEWILKIAILLYEKEAKFGGISALTSSLELDRDTQEELRRFMPIRNSIIHGIGDHPANLEQSGVELASFNGRMMNKLIPMAYDNILKFDFQAIDPETRLGLSVAIASQAYEIIVIPLMIPPSRTAQLGAAILGIYKVTYRPIFAIVSSASKWSFVRWPSDAPPILGVNRAVVAFAVPGFVTANARTSKMGPPCKLEMTWGGPDGIRPSAHHLNVTFAHESPRTLPFRPGGGVPAPNRSGSQE